MQAYCVKCRSKKEMQNPQQIKMKNGKPATKGVCPDCGTGMYRIGKAEQSDLIFVFDQKKNPAAMQGFFLSAPDAIHA